MIFESHESKDTFEFGKKMAQEANAGDVICLLGDLGGRLRSWKNSIYTRICHRIRHYRAS